MLELKTKKELAQHAHTLARGSELVRHRAISYLPIDYETGDRSLPPAPERTSWIPLSRFDIQVLGAETFNILFGSEAELSSFEFMIAQNSRYVNTSPSQILLRTQDGLRVLDESGRLVDPPGSFVPNTLSPMLNEDPKAKQEVFEVVAGWLNSEEEAHSLLHHLATALAPGWSAVKYVLLLGDGRNGKSVLLKMLQSLFGVENASSVTRQQISEGSPVTTELNGKLLNIVFDGKAEYVKDSGNEKSLIAGEPVQIRKLYESTPTPVQTHALFIEGLNREPKSSDKSTALQKRLSRFHFPNVYPLDHAFEKRMLMPHRLGAFLALLIDHFVAEDEVAEKLAPTEKGLALQLDQMHHNSLALQHLQHLEETEAFGAIATLTDMLFSDLAEKFKAWRLQQNDLSEWAEPDILTQYQPVINTDRVSRRIDGKPRKVRVVTSLKPEGLAFIESLEGVMEDADEAILALVED